MQRLKRVFQGMAVPGWLFPILWAADQWSRAQVFREWIRMVQSFGQTLWPLIIGFAWLGALIVWPDIKRIVSKPQGAPAAGGRISRVIVGRGQKINCGTPGTGDFEIKTDGRPLKLFFEQAMLMVTEDELPKSVRVGASKFRIKRFTDSGFLVDDFGVPVGFEVWVLDWIPKT
jgi:hypothetical protein